MRKFTKLLLTLALLFGAVGVNSVKAISLGDEITSLPGITDGTMFIISNGTNAKYFYTNNENENAELASIPADAYFYFTLEKYTDGDIPNSESPADNIYRIKITNANGEGYPRGTNSGCYLNAVLSYADVVISAEEAGWSDKKCALWYVSYDAEKGFSFQNVYRAGASLKSWLAIGNNFVADQQYLKLYSEPADPLAEFKAALSAKIARANMYNGVAYTTASFNALTAEITTAQAALAAAASAESLTTATTNLQAKIDALVFAEGYENLTAAMFKVWDKADAADAVSTGTANCTYNLFTATDLPYGESSVGYLHYADLSSYDKLIVVATAKRPRIMMNRDVNEGQWNETESDSHLIDNTKGGWSAKYFSNENNVYTADLAKLVADKGFAHLNAIKVEGWQVTDVITGMYLYKTPDPLGEYKDALKDKITEANAINTFGRSAESIATLTQAINNGNAALVNAEATQESLESATAAIDDAIAGLVLADGYTDLKKDMFMTYASVDKPGDGTKPGESCAYVIRKATGQPYGDGNVGEQNWADLAGYDKLYIVTMGTVKPRIMFNRLVKDGTQAATQEDSKMIEINPNGENAPTWSTEKYQTINGNVYEIDLNAIREDYGFVRLHAIKKQGWGDDMYVTDMLLYKSDADVAVKVSSAGWTSFSSDKNVTIPNGITAYTASYNGNYVELASVTEIPAGDAVLIEGTIGTYRLPVVANAAAIGNNELLVSDGTVTGESGSIYALSKGSHGVGFYKVGASVTVPAGKAYMVIEDAIIATREFVGFGNATGIREVQTEESADNSLYNLAGQRVVKAQKGLFIQNGKKFFVK